MASKDEYRIFVGGLSWNISERQLENAFIRFGKMLELKLLDTLQSFEGKTESFQIMLERDTGRPRGFGFITFADRRGMDDAIREMHGQELGERIISVNKAEPKMEGDDTEQGFRGGGYSSGVGGGRGGGRGSFSSRSRFDSDGRGDRFGGDRDRYVDERYNGGRYGDRDRFDRRDDKYGSRDRYFDDRYPSAGDRFTGSDRYDVSDRYPQNGYVKDRVYDRDIGPRSGSDRYGSGGPGRHEGRSYRDRTGPYDRPSRVGRPSSYDRY
ncbi:hypothetical protein Csa_021693 [Cucumis sativus]|nr:hypothetical protein Csa_021693 [Cucumis sativus]